MQEDIAEDDVLSPSAVLLDRVISAIHPRVNFLLNGI